MSWLLAIDAAAVAVAGIDLAKFTRENPAVPDEWTTKDSAFVVAAFAFLLVLAGCEPPPGKSVSILDVAPEARTCDRAFVVRSGFVPWQVQTIGRAAEDLKSASSGRMAPRFADDARSYISPVHRWSPDVVAYEEKHPKEIVLGLTRCFQPWDVCRIVIVVDRLTEANAWRVAAHEMMHACGIPDLDTSGDVMSRVGTTGAEPRWFTTDDYLLMREKGLAPWR